jgi:hypothetical protein
MLMSSHLAITTSSVSQSRMRVPSFGAVSIGCQSTILSQRRLLLSVGSRPGTWEKLRAFILGFDRIVECVERQAKPYIFNVGRQGQLSRIPIP